MKQEGGPRQGLYNETKEQAGVGIAIHKTLLKYVRKVEPEGSRIIRCTMNFEKHLEISGAYAPPACTRTQGQTLDTPKEKKDKFYD